MMFPGKDGRRTDSSAISSESLVDAQEEWLMAIAAAAHNLAHVPCCEFKTPDCSYQPEFRKEIHHER